MDFGNYESLFRRATGIESEPYPYQKHLAANPFPNLLEAPTGMGKTAAVILAWLWQRLHEVPDVPRRLVWCLPMRVLVEQTRQCVETWLKNLDLQDVIKVHVLMGGEDAADWDVYPEQMAVLIGTQDMLISRALNRGYGMSRYRWPMHFGLLNNDCLWILDEVQLMGSGLATTAQLHAFRNSLGTFGNCRSLWMSATLNPQWLATVDLDHEELGSPLRLTDADRNRSRTYNAFKPLNRATASMGDADALAGEVLSAHRPASRTLVVANTVARATEIYERIRVRGKNRAGTHIILIHSRFRAEDRAAKIQCLMEDPPPEGAIIVSTQVVEAGVDVSARVLFTELAPWASLVQRFGRCNRRGEYGDGSPAQVFWIDLPADSMHHKPYELEDLDAAKELLIQCANGVGPSALDELNAELEFKHSHVIRRKDLIELFDTTPDLAGNDTDIDRYVRDLDSSDVQVFWRDFAGVPAEDEPLPRCHELCPAPIGSFKAFADKLAKVEELRKRGVHTPFRRNYLERRWESAGTGDIYPGQMYMVATVAGGYDRDTGWTGKPNKSARRHAVPAVAGEPRSSIGPDDGNDAEPYSRIGVWQELSKHSAEAHAELGRIVDHLPHVSGFRQPLLSAVRWHDLGKSHWVFRHALPDLGEHDPFIPWAKAPRRGWKRYMRKHFRHELASALAVLQESSGEIPECYRSLIAYLVAAHHGKVRLSIRSLPGESRPPDSRVRFARGVWDGDSLPETDLGDGVVAPAVVLSLEPMELGESPDGGPSWGERMLALRDDPKLGPFRLAYMESLLRAADMRVSARVAEVEQ